MIDLHNQKEQSRKRSEFWVVVALLGLHFQFSPLWARGKINFPDWSLGRAIWLGLTSGTETFKRQYATSCSLSLCHSDPPHGTRRDQKNGMCRDTDGKDVDWLWRLKEGPSCPGPSRISSGECFQEIPASVRSLSPLSLEPSPLLLPVSYRWCITSTSPWGSKDEWPIVPDIRKPIVQWKREKEREAYNAARWVWQQRSIQSAVEHRGGLHNHVWRAVG